MRPISGRLVLWFSVFAMLGTIAAQGARTPPAFYIQEDPVIDEDAYWRLVQRSRDTVTSLKGRPMDEIKTALAGLADEWEAIREVRTAEGLLIPLDHGDLPNSLRADPPRLEELAALLTTLSSAHENYPDRFFSPADLESLQAVLARPEFNRPEAQPNPLNLWFQRIWERLNQWLNSLFGDGPIRVTVDLSLLPVIASILLGIILLLVLRTLFSDFVREARDAPDQVGEDEILTSKSAFEKAHVLSQAGDFRSAVRYLYLSSLLVLDERGLLRYDRTKTNREYLRSISNSPSLAAPLEEVIEVFDDVWYGYHSLGEETFRHYSDRVQDLKEKKG